MLSEAGGCSQHADRGWLSPCWAAPTISQWWQMCLSRVVLALFVAVVCGGVRTQTTPNPFGPVVWLLNWSDRLEGRSRHSRSHYSTLCTLTFGVCVCLQFSVLICGRTWHMSCVFSVWFMHLALLHQPACCCVCSLVKNKLYCALTQAIWTTWQSCVHTHSSIKSPPTLHIIRSSVKNKNRSSVCGVFCQRS